MSVTNKVEISGTVKWDPNVFPPRNDEQKPILVFAVEHHKPKSQRTSVFHVKAYGDLVDTLTAENLAQGDKVVVTGSLNEAKWKDKQTDEWKNRIEIWAFNVEFVERAGAPDLAGVAASFDDIPF